MSFLIKKRDGTLEEYDEEKIVSSLKRSGANSEAVTRVLRHIQTHKASGEISSDELYRLSAKALREVGESKTFIRYNLPNAVSKLGPDGFSFEKFIGKVFQAYSYSPVIVGKKIAGKCMMHEMDIIAKKGNILTTAELKFHNSRNKKSDLKVVLYMKARFDDILNADYYGDDIPRQVIITNTKFTYNAKIYANCAGVEVLAWDYPQKNNLHDFILKSGIHPVTALQNVSSKAAAEFLKKGKVSCLDLLKNNSRALHQNEYISKEKIPVIEEEINEMVHMHL